MTWAKSLLHVTGQEQTLASGNGNGNGAMTPQQREVDEQVRMDELWARLAAVAEEIREIITIKESLGPKC